MNCEKCSTPMLWIGTMSRGGLDCPKCAAERPVVFDMGRKPTPELFLTTTPASSVFDEIRAEQSMRRKEYFADLEGQITGDIMTIGTVPKDTVIDPETMRRLSELALLDEAKQLGVITDYFEGDLPDKTFFDEARVAGQVVVSGGGYWIATTPDEVGGIFPKHWGPPSKTSLTYGLVEANHFRALELRGSEEDARIASLIDGIPCTDTRYDPDMRGITKTKG